MFHKFSYSNLKHHIFNVVAKVRKLRERGYANEKNEFVGTHCLFVNSILAVLFGQQIYVIMYVNEISPRYFLVAI